MTVSVAGVSRLSIVITAIGAAIILASGYVSFATAQADTLASAADTDRDQGATSDASRVDDSDGPTPSRAADPSIRRNIFKYWNRTQFALAVLGVVLVACSALLFLVLRAMHDPPINQANPTTFSRLAYVIGRKQYEVQGILPRQAPVWLQLANWFEYADWQVALSLAPSVIPNVWRVLFTFGERDSNALHGVRGSALASPT